MSAMAMAIYLRGMTVAEIASLTRHMLQSGEQLTWPEGPPRVDKHSSGGRGRQGLDPARTDARLLRGGGPDDLRPGPGLHRRDARQAGVDPRFPHRPVTRRDAGGGRPRRLRHHRCLGRARPRRPQALRPPRRDGHRAVDPDDHREHNEQEARRGARCAGARREVRHRRLHEDRRPGPRTGTLARTHRSRDGHRHHGALDGHEPTAGPHGGQRRGDRRIGRRPPRRGGRRT